MSSAQELRKSFEKYLCYFESSSYLSFHFENFLMITSSGGRFIKELQTAAKVERIELQKDRDIYEQYAGFYGRYAHIAGDFPCRLHAVYLMLRRVRCYILCHDIMSSFDTYCQMISYVEFI